MHEGDRLDPGVRVAAIRRLQEMLDREGYRCVLPERERFVPG